MDKYYRLMRGFNWWPDEQPSDEIKEACWHKMEECGFVVDTVLSHTCPYKYIPREAFLPMINQDSVDDSTEKWLDNIESRLYYERWYPMMSWPHMTRCYMVFGHIHGNTDADYWPLIRENDLMLNAGADVNGFAPVTFEEMQENNYRHKAGWNPELCTMEADQ